MTFIPFTNYEGAAVRSNPRIQVVATEHGGRLEFLARQPHRLWADHAIMYWITSRS